MGEGGNRGAGKRMGWVDGRRRDEIAVNTFSKRNFKFALQSASVIYVLTAPESNNNNNKKPQREKRARERQTGRQTDRQTETDRQAG